MEIILCLLIINPGINNSLERKMPFLKNIWNSENTPKFKNIFLGHDI